MGKFLLLCVVTLLSLFNYRSECQIREHIISASPENPGEMLSTFSTINSSDTLPLSLSTNTTFTSFYGSHEILNTLTTTT